MVRFTATALPLIDTCSQRLEGRMMVAGNRGFMPIEMRGQMGRTESAIRRIPLTGQQGQLKNEYYCYWPKDRTYNLIEEFADILAGMFEVDDQFMDRTRDSRMVR